MFPRAGQRRGGPSFFSAAGSRATLIVLGIGAAWLGWYAIWGTAFRIDNIEVTGVSVPAEEAIRAGIDRHVDGNLLGMFPRSNVLFFDTEKALADVSGHVALEQITVRKRFPHTIVVTAGEKIARAALDRDGRLYALDETGMIIRELSEDEITALGVLPPGMDAVPTQGLGAETVEVASAKPAVAPTAVPSKESVPLIMAAPDARTGTTQEAQPGATAVPSAAMRLILQAHVRLPDIADDTIRWFIVQPSSETIEAITTAGWKILMSSALPFDVQGDRLGIVLKEKIGARKASLDYIDLRYNERIFFRMKGEAAQ